MIAIINRGQPKRGQEHDRVYDIIIGERLITCFIHDRQDGLAVCLEKAALAVREKKEVEVLDSILGRDE